VSRAGGGEVSGLTVSSGPIPASTASAPGFAVGGAIALGDELSGRRFHWAVIAAFITFMGANNAGQQVRKAVFRVVGTAAIPRSSLGAVAH
jgi:hypothetical protein